MAQKATKMPQKCHENAKKCHKNATKMAQICHKNATKAQKWHKNVREKLAEENLPLVNDGASKKQYYGSVDLTFMFLFKI